MVLEVVKTNKKNHKKEIFENGYRKGIGTALLMCSSLLQDNIINSDVVDSQPECSPFIKETLRRMAGLSPSAKESLNLWEKPKFLRANNYIRQFNLHERV